MEHLHKWGIPAKQILLDPLLRPHADYMTGCLFQIHLIQDSAGTSLAAAAGKPSFLCCCDLDKDSQSLGCPLLPGQMSMKASDCKQKMPNNHCEDALRPMSMAGVFLPDMLRQADGISSIELLNHRSGGQRAHCARPAIILVLVRI